MADNRDDERSRDPGRGYYDKYGKWVEYRDIANSPGHRRPMRQGVVFAVILIAVGVLLFLDNIGVFHFHDIWRFWPVALIAVGVAKLFDCRGVGGRIWAAMWIFVGAAFLIDRLSVGHVNWNIIWPLALIGFGVMTRVKALERRRVPAGLIGSSSAGTSEDNTLREWATFSGIKRRMETPNFQGGEMLAVFGGIDIDLRRAAIAPGTKEVVIDANATFGGIELRVPETWLVVTRGLGIFGGYEDKTDPPTSPDAPKVVIKGFAVFGGIAVKN